MTEIDKLIEKHTIALTSREKGQVVSYDERVMDVFHLTQDLAALISRKAREARIDELNSLYDEAESPEQYDTCEVVHDHTIAQRIEELNNGLL